MRTLIKNVSAVLPSGITLTNVLIDGDKIASVDAPLTSQADKIIDASGLHLIPGLIDDQVHFREPGITHKEDLTTASRACVLGGVTSFLEMPNTNPNTISQAALEQKLALGKEKSRANYGFYIGATTTNVLELKYAHRTPGIKIFVGSSTGNLLVDDQSALELIYSDTKLRICVHAEDESTIKANMALIGKTSDVRDHSRIRDHAAAYTATKRVRALAEHYQHHTHILHVSSRTELPLLDSPYLSSEACVHHLLLNTTDYDRLGNLIQMNPSIKDPEDNAALWQALKDGVIDVIATDHAPHTILEKAAPYPASPSGMPGVQTMLTLCLNEVAKGNIQLEDLVRWTSTNPAKLWGIENKGQIIEGFDADLVLVDLKATRAILNKDQASKCGWTPWEGRTTTGWPTHTFVLGQLAMENGVLNDNVRGREITYSHDA